MTRDSPIRVVTLFGPAGILASQPTHGVQFRRPGVRDFAASWFIPQDDFAVGSRSLLQTSRIAAGFANHLSIPFSTSGIDFCDLRLR